MRRDLMAWVRLSLLFLFGAISACSWTSSLKSEHYKCPDFNQPPRVPSESTFAVLGEGIGLLRFPSLQVDWITAVHSPADVIVSPDGMYILIAARRESLPSEIPSSVAFDMQQLAQAPEARIITNYYEKIELLDTRNGNVISIILPETLRSYLLEGWLNDHELIFVPVVGIVTQGFQRVPIVDVSQPEGSAFAYDPFTGLLRQISPNIPEEISLDHFLVVPRAWDYPLAYNPAGEKVFYFGRNHATSSTSLVMLDILRNKVLWYEDVNPGVPYGPGIWSDSGLLAYLETDGLYKAQISILRQDGARTQLNLGEQGYVPARTPLPFSWSPGGKYLGFLRCKNNEEQTCLLSMYEAKSGKIINTCILGQGEFFWSPDGSKVLIRERNHQYLWFDVEKNYAIRFDFGQGYIIGWVK